MNASEPKSSVFASDRRIVEEIERILPQAYVKSLSQTFAHGGAHNLEDATNFERLRQRFKEVGFTPKATAVKKAFNLFKQRFLRLDGILFQNFGLNSRMPILNVHPRRMDTRWHRKLIEKLKHAGTDFEAAYFDLLKTAAEDYWAAQELKSHQSSTVERVARIKIYISSQKGIYVDQKRRYPIRGKSKRFKCVQRLLEAGFLDSEDLKDFWKGSALRTNEIREINKLTGAKLELGDNLIIYSETAGHYALNTEKFDISSE